MKRDCTDFFIVEDRHLVIHERLNNWSRYVSTRKHGWPTAPIWRLGKSNGRQWHEPALKIEVDQLDGLKLERAVGLLPIPHREAIRWMYVWKTGPTKARRALGVTNDGLMKLVSDARQMLVNRGA